MRLLIFVMATFISSFAYSAQECASITGMSQVAIENQKAKMRLAFAKEENREISGRTHLEETKYTPATVEQSITRTVWSKAPGIVFSKRLDDDYGDLLCATTR